MDILEKERAVQRNIIEIFKENFGTTITESEILDTIPEKEFKSNLASYYEAISDLFFIEPENLESIKGKVKDTIKRVAELWTVTFHYFLP